MADYPAVQFFGTKQAGVVNTTTNIASTNWGATGTIYDNTSDAAVPFAQYAQCTVVCPAWAGVPTVGGFVVIGCVKQDVDGTTDDTDPPSTTSDNGVQVLGIVTIAPSNTLQRRTITVNMTGIKKGAIYTKNMTSQSMNNGGGTAHTVDMQPFSFGVTQ